MPPLGVPRWSKTSRTCRFTSAGVPKGTILWRSRSVRKHTDPANLFESASSPMTFAWQLITRAPMSIRSGMMSMMLPSEWK